MAAKSVQDMELSVRSRKALQRLNINTVAELASRTEAELLGCKNFWQTSLTEIKERVPAMYAEMMQTPPVQSASEASRIPLSP